MPLNTSGLRRATENVRGWCAIVQSRDRRDGLDPIGARRIRRAGRRIEKEIALRQQMLQSTCGTGALSLPHKMHWPFRTPLRVQRPRSFGPVLDDFCVAVFGGMGRAVVNVPALQ